MADYYPLIARAVAGMEKNTGEARRMLYERARAALVAQLRSISPALSETDVTRERLALEEAIRKVEGESARQVKADQGRGEVPKMRGPSLPRYEGLQPVDPPSRKGFVAAVRRAVPMLDPEVPRARDPGRDLPMPAEPPPSPSRGRPAPDRRVAIDTGLKDLRDTMSEAEELGGASARAVKSARDSFSAVPPPPPLLSPRHPDRAPRDQDMMMPSVVRDGPQMLESDFAMDDLRPVSPRGRQAPYRPADDDAGEGIGGRGSIGNILKIVIVVLILAGAAGLLVWQWPNVTALLRVFNSPTQVAREAPQPPRNKIPDRIEPGSQQQQAGSSLAPQIAAVAQRVVLYEEDPADPAGKRYVGSAIWRTETLAPAPGQSPELAVRADIEIPDRRIAMTWSFRRNSDLTLPASHTVEIMFKLPPDFSFGGISNVPGILMKQAEQTRGVPLAGLAVKVTNGFFLIGLSNVEADRERNLTLLKERGWFDIPVVYNNNRRAILAMEKGTPGERAFTEAFKAWGQ
jgi:hypothetical protein